MNNEVIVYTIDLGEGRTAKVEVTRAQEQNYLKWLKILCPEMYEVRARELGLL